jgi:cephalosporin-C deacetylase-like acetyl esterase
MAKFDLKKAILENKATFFSSLTEGQFSWMTQDTGQQIGSEEENMIPVYMFDDKGKYYYEKNYDDCNYSHCIGFSLLTKNLHNHKKRIIG